MQAASATFPSSRLRPTKPAHSRLQIEMSPDVLERLEEFKKLESVTTAEVVRRALQVLLFLERDRQHRILVVDDAPSRPAREIELSQIELSQIELPELRLLLPESERRPVFMGLASAAVIAGATCIAAAKGYFDRLPSPRLVAAGIAATLSGVLVNLVSSSIDRHGLVGTGRPFVIQYVMIALAIILGIVALALVAN